MLFNTLSFLLFFPLTTAAYFALPHRSRWAFLLACSTLFYSGWIIVASEHAPWAWLYLLVLAFVILVDYLAGLAIDATRGTTRKLFLIASLLANIGILGIFKYFTFLNANFHSLGQFLHFNFPVRHLGLLLPIGLSFHTFQSMSYTIEVYLGRQRAEKHLGIYALYVMFYPQLVAGPIERPQNLLHQLREYHEFDADRIFSGLRLMLWGYFKKVVIADRLGAIVDPIYHNPRAWGGAYLWLATCFFAFQIYCDFAGYCDIAIGAARVLGVKLMDNFDRPYAARSIADFWRRWHISLSTWFRDYLYIPLGGNRVPLPRWCVNVMIVFVISGLWHGASWTFVIWGALHGFYLIIERAAAVLRQRLAVKTAVRLPPSVFRGSAIARVGFSVGRGFTHPLRQ
jgi:alginate O-acetyltransferase complex protein AlgI